MMSGMKKIDEKAKGYFKYVLALDCETGGVAMQCDDPSYNPKTKQLYPSISWGIVVLNGSTLKEVESLYLEIKVADDYAWDPRTEKVHGLTREYLNKNGLEESEAVEKIANLIIKYWGPDGFISLMGHNVMFDKWFLQRLMRRQDIELNFSNRLIDTNSLGYILLETYTSDELFKLVGLPKRNDHNALEDIKHTIEVARRLRNIFQIAVMG